MLKKKVVVEGKVLLQQVMACRKVNPYLGLDSLQPKYCFPKSYRLNLSAVLREFRPKSKIRVVFEEVDE